MTTPSTSLLSQKAKNFQPSPTLMLAAKAKEMKDRGEDVLSLTVGEPDWQTYPKASEAGIQAIRDGKTKYTASQGVPALRKAIAQQMKKLTAQDYNPANEVAVTSGAKFVVVVNEINQGCGDYTLDLYTAPTTSASASPRVAWASPRRSMTPCAKKSTSSCTCCTAPCWPCAGSASAASAQRCACCYRWCWSPSSATR